ncbi:MAG: CE1759 family FMN reductase [Propionicimonas sp.]
MSTDPRPLQLVVVSAGASDPSSTRLLADRIAGRVVARAEQRGQQVHTTVIDLRTMAGEISSALVSQHTGPRLKSAIETLARADGLVVSTPVYKAAASGLFTSFFQVLDNDLLIARPVVLAATAGTARHALVVDEQLRALFAYLRTLTVPTSLFAASEDWGDPALNKRIDRAAIELVLLLESDFANQVKAASWDSYSHEFGSAGGTELGIDLDSDLMRLAAGGSLDGHPVGQD